MLIVPKLRRRQLLLIVPAAVPAKLIVAPPLMSTSRLRVHVPPTKLACPVTITRLSGMATGPCIVPPAMPMLTTVKVAPEAIVKVLTILMPPVPVPLQVPLIVPASSMNEPVAVSNVPFVCDPFITRSPTCTLTRLLLLSGGTMFVPPAPAVLSTVPLLLIAPPPVLLIDPVDWRSKMPVEEMFITPLLLIAHDPVSFALPLTLIVEPSSVPPAIVRIAGSEGSVAMFICPLPVSVPDVKVKKLLSWMSIVPPLLIVPPFTSRVEPVLTLAPLSGSVPPVFTLIEHAPDVSLSVTAFGMTVPTVTETLENVKFAVSPAAEPGYVPGGGVGPDGPPWRQVLLSSHAPPAGETK